MDSVTSYSVKNPPDSQPSHGKPLGRILYESYKPKTLAEVKEYIEFVLAKRTILPNEHHEFDPDCFLDGLSDIPRGPDFDFSRPVDRKFSQSLYAFLTNEIQKRQGFSVSEKKKVDPRMRHYLWFDALFECANLCKAVAISPVEYELYLNSDTNSPNRTQWFYFMVTNTKKGQTVKFTLMNQTKSPYFYKEGMTPLVFSEKDNHAMYVSWAAKTENMYLSRVSVQAGRMYGNRFIAIGRKDASEEYVEPPECYHTLSFTHTFKYSDDRVYFAFNKPYCFSLLRKYIAHFESRLLQSCTSLQQNSETLIETDRIYYKRERLCYSLGGIPVYILTLTSPHADGLSKSKYIIITSRVHSSETPGSYKVEGILNFLLSKDPVAELLLREFVFLVVPMLNPDGVVLGNNRCSLYGTDLNRCWGRPSVSKHPTVFNLKKRLRELVANNKEIYVYCDLHGHSKLLNSFIYACHKVSGTFCPWSKVRLLPRILAKKSHLLDYHKCRFKVEQEKLNTARVIIWKEFKVVNSFTLESSMYAYTVGDEVVRFSEREYRGVGEALMQALGDYKKLCDEFPQEIAENPHKLLGQMGIPAADMLRNEIKEDREREKRTREKLLRERRAPQKAGLQINKASSLHKVNQKYNTRETTDTEPPKKTLPYKNRAASWVTVKKDKTPLLVPYQGPPPDLPKPFEPKKIVFPQLPVSNEISLLGPSQCESLAFKEKLVVSPLVNRKLVPLKNLVKLTNEYQRKNRGSWQPIQLEKRIHIGSLNNNNKIKRNVNKYLRKAEDGRLLIPLSKFERLKAHKYLEELEEPGLYGTLKYEPKENEIELGIHNRSFVYSENCKASLGDSVNINDIEMMPKVKGKRSKFSPIQSEEYQPLLQGSYMGLGLFNDRSKAFL